METYNVILHKGVDYQSFWDDMESSDDGGNLYIPNRRVDSPNLRPNSPRQTWYTLSEEEVQILKNDDRVMEVEIPPDFRDDIFIEPRLTQTGDFTKTSSDSGQYINWGLIRHKSKTNNYGSGTSTSEDYTYHLDGSNVDIVIQDSGLQFDHPEFKGPDGVERTVTIDWYSLSGVTGTQNANHDRDLDGHGTHVAGIAAGKNHGVAKNANVYFVKVSGLEGASDSGTGISVTDCFDVIKGWHNNKTDNIETGRKNPTVVNMSWGYGTYFDSVTSLTYRGTSYSDTNTTTNSGYRESNYGLVYNSGANAGRNFVANVRIASVDTDVEELIDAGVVVTIAAGNRGNKVDVVGGTDYNNFVVTNVGTTYYHRGSSPYSDRAILVGNMDSSLNAATNPDTSNKDQKAFSSECGPGVDIYAAGTNIMSCTSNTNKFSDAPYYFDNSYRQCNIGGTSMAAPQVAGMAALILQQNPSAKPESVKASLEGLCGDSTLYTSNEEYYISTPLVSDSTNSTLYGKSLHVNGIKVVQGAAVGGQSAVPDAFTEKVAQMIKLMVTSSGADINDNDQANMIGILNGETGTWHSGYPTAQRILRGAGSDYSPNPLIDANYSSYPGLQNFQDSHATDDMVWYLNSSAASGSGDNDAQEVIEHIFHTIHQYGVRGAVSGSFYGLSWDPETDSDWNTRELYYAIKEAVDDSVFDITGYGDENYNTASTFKLIAKEYLYLLNFNMWEYSSLWSGGSLSPEWNDNSRTVAGIQTNNPLGYALYNDYIKPVLTKPSLTTIRSIFQDGDVGDPTVAGSSGYTPEASTGNDWSDRRSLLGGERRILFNKNTNDKPTIIQNVPNGFFQGGVKITTK
jgi:subtilisin family serine protease